MSLVGYTFTFGEDIRDAFGINAWDSRTGSSGGYYYIAVSLEGGDYVDEWVAILTPVLEENGFEWDDTYGFVNYTTYQQISVYYNESYNTSVIQIWQ